MASTLSTLTQPHPPMNPRPSFIFLFLFLTLPLTASAQRHLPDLQIFQTVEYVQLDTYVESPAINHGITTTSIPVRGQNVVFQIFVPRSGGRIAYQCGIQLQNPNNALTRSFENISIVDWQKRALTPLPPASYLSFENKNLIFSLIPFSGHIATVTMTPRETLQKPLPINLSCTVTVVSSPPRRVWQMTGPQTLHWR